MPHPQSVFAITQAVELRLWSPVAKPTIVGDRDTTRSQHSCHRQGVMKPLPSKNSTFFSNRDLPDPGPRQSRGRRRKLLKQPRATTGPRELSVRRTRPNPEVWLTRGSMKAHRQQVLVQLGRSHSIEATKITEAINNNVRNPQRSVRNMNIINPQTQRT